MFKFRKGSAINTQDVFVDDVRIGTVTKGSDIYGTVWLALQPDGRTGRFVTRNEAAGSLVRPSDAGCQHANTEDRPVLRPGQQPTGDLLCGAESDAWKLPDGTTGYYCNQHGPQVVERVRRRMNRQEGRA